MGTRAELGAWARRQSFAWRRETYALPLDVFRVLAGALSIAYFVALAREGEDFSDPRGLLDHTVIERVFWFTRLSAFQPSIGGWVRGCYVLAALASLGIVLGYRVKLCALVAFVIAASACRWFFPVMFVDDSIVQLLLFWLLLLPVGKTLTLAGWLRGGRAVLGSWTQVVVPGVAVRSLLGNVFLLYVVAGCSKFYSPLWRSGFALYAILHLPVAWRPDAWGPEQLELLLALNYGALLIEPVIPVLLLMPVGHPLKWLGFASVVGFHAGIILTLKVPLANLACIAALVLSFREELMVTILRDRRALPALAVRPRIDASGRLGAMVLALLTAAMLGGFPSLSSVYHGGQAALWCLGLAQDYHLFNWIDFTNWATKAHLVARGANGTRTELDATTMFPNSVRGALLGAYLYDKVWMQVSARDRVELAQSMLPRLARRFCSRYEGSEPVLVESDVQRITPDNLLLDHPEHRFVMEFTCRGAEAVILRSPFSPLGMVRPADGPT